MSTELLQPLQLRVFVNSTENESLSRHVDFEIQAEEIHIDKEYTSVYFSESNSDIFSLTLDTGAPYNVANKKDIMNYIEKNGLKEEEVKLEPTDINFRFGPSKMYRWENIIFVGEALQLM